MWCLMLKLYAQPICSFAHLHIIILRSPVLKCAFKQGCKSTWTVYWFKSFTCKPFELCCWHENSFRRTIPPNEFWGILRLPIKSDIFNPDYSPATCTKHAGHQIQRNKLGIPCSQVSWNLQSCVLAYGKCPSGLVCTQPHLVTLLTIDNGNRRQWWATHFPLQYDIVTWTKYSLACLKPIHVSTRWKASLRGGLRYSHSWGTRPLLLSSLWALARTPVHTVCFKHQQRWRTSDMSSYCALSTWLKVKLCYRLPPLTHGFSNQCKIHIERLCSIMFVTRWL